MTTPLGPPPFTGLLGTRLSLKSRVIPAYHKPVAGDEFTPLPVRGWKRRDFYDQRASDFTAEDLDATDAAIAIAQKAYAAEERSSRLEADFWEHVLTLNGRTARVTRKIVVSPNGAKHELWLAVWL